MLEEVQTIISQEFDIERSEILPKSDLRNDLHVDSLAAVNLSFEVEKAFDIKISDEELASLRTVGDIVNLVKKKQAAASSK